MKRNKYGFSHKVKGSMDFGLWYPVLCQDMVPGDILRVRPEAIVKSVIPPVTALTDKITYKIEFSFTPDRILDDHFVRNLSTTKSGTVKGDFKTWTLDQIEREYGSSTRGYTSPTRVSNGSSGAQYVTPLFRRNKSFGNVASLNCTYRDGFNTTDNISENSIIDYSEALPVATRSPNKDNKVHIISCAPMFGQNSLWDWLSLDINGNIGQKDTNDAYVRCAPFSAYYMYMNFYHTNPEYQKYIAPHFDYVYSGRDNSENRETLLRYVTLEDQFGNEFEEPFKCGRCVNGLVIDNWHSDYFTRSTKDPVRGIAPQVPVSITGKQFVMTEDTSGNVLFNTTSSSVNGNSSGVAVNGNSRLVVDCNDGYKNSIFKGIAGSFVISDLRSALALQHFQEDTQYTYKWSDFLQKVFGTSPVDLLVDQPKFLGSMKGVLSSTEVLQTVETDSGSLGDIGGHLSGFSQGKLIKYRAKEHGWFMAFMVIKVERNYESGVERMFTRRNYLDMFFPQFVGIGNQGIRRDELVSCVGSSIRDGNICFTSRYEEMKHKYNRVVGKCRNSNIVMPLVYVRDENDKAISGGDPLPHIAYRGGYTSLNQVFTDTYEYGPYLNTFHPYAIGDAYYDNGVNKSAVNDVTLKVSEINSDFLLCCPQLNDIFVDDTEEPFMVTLGFDMDMFRPLPVYLKPGISYV